MEAPWVNVLLLTFGNPVDGIILVRLVQYEGWLLDGTKVGAALILVDFDSCSSNLVGIEVVATGVHGLVVDGPLPDFVRLDIAWLAVMCLRGVPA